MVKDKYMKRNSITNTLDVIKNVHTSNPLPRNIIHIYLFARECLLYPYTGVFAKRITNVRRKSQIIHDIESKYYKEYVDSFSIDDNIKEGDKINTILSHQLPPHVIINSYGLFLVPLDRATRVMSKILSFYNYKEFTDIYRKVEHSSLYLTETGLLSTPDGMYTYIREMNRLFIQCTSVDGKDLSWKEIMQIKNNSKESVDENENEKLLYDNSKCFLVNLDLCLQVLIDVLLQRSKLVDHKLEDIFVDGDDNNDGVLSFEEFTKIVHVIQPNFHERRIIKMYREALMDGNDNDTIGPQAFVTVCKKYDIVQIVDIEDLRTGGLKALCIPSDRYINKPDNLPLFNSTRESTTTTQKSPVSFLKSEDFLQKFSESISNMNNHKRKSSISQSNSLASSTNNSPTHKSNNNDSNNNDNNDKDNDEIKRIYLRRKSLSTNTSRRNSPKGNELSNILPIDKDHRISIKSLSKHRRKSNIEFVVKDQTDQTPIDVSINQSNNFNTNLVNDIEVHTEPFKQLNVVNSELNNDTHLPESSENNNNIIIDSTTSTSNDEIKASELSNQLNSIANPIISPQSKTKHIISLVGAIDTQSHRTEEGEESPILSAIRRNLARHNELKHTLSIDDIYKSATPTDKEINSISLKDIHSDSIKQSQQLIHQLLYGESVDNSPKKTLTRGIPSERFIYSNKRIDSNSRSPIRDKSKINDVNDDSIDVSKNVDNDTVNANNDSTNTNTVLENEFLTNSLTALSAAINDITEEDDQNDDNTILLDDNFNTDSNKSIKSIKLPGYLQNTVNSNSNRYSMSNRSTMATPSLHRRQTKKILISNRVNISGQMLQDVQTYASNNNNVNSYETNNHNNLNLYNLIPSNKPHLSMKYLTPLQISQHINEQPILNLINNPKIISDYNEGNIIPQISPIVNPNSFNYPMHSTSHHNKKHSHEKDVNEIFGGNVLNIKSIIPKEISPISNHNSSNEMKDKDLNSNINYKADLLGINRSISYENINEEKSKVIASEITKQLKLRKILRSKVD